MGACKGRELFYRHKGIIVPYSSLPKHAKKSIIQFMCEENGIELDKNRNFGYVELPLSALIEAVDVADTTFKTFKEYHEWYIKDETIATYRNMWSIILDNNRNEVIYDGWHRFHYYVENRVKVVSLVMFLKN